MEPLKPKNAIFKHCFGWWQVSHHWNMINLGQLENVMNTTRSKSKAKSLTSSTIVMLLQIALPSMAQAPPKIQQRLLDVKIISIVKSSEISTKSLCTINKITYLTDPTTNSPMLDVALWVTLSFYFLREGKVVRLNNWLAVCFELYVGCWLFIFFLFLFFPKDELVGTGIVGRFFLWNYFLMGTMGCWDVSIQFYRQCFCKS